MLEELAARLTFMQTLYGFRLLLPGESKAGSMERLIDYLDILHGKEAVSKLSNLPFQDLKEAIKELGIACR